MANTNFKTWLGSDTLSGANSQQNTYNGIINGFSAGGQIKAGDFNAALRMTTLVCAGIAAACGFDTSTIDASESAITSAINNNLILPYTNLLAQLNQGTNSFIVDTANTATTANMANGLTAKEAIVSKDASGSTATFTFKSATSGYTVTVKVNRIEAESIGGATLTGNFYDLTAAHNFTTYNFEQKISSIGSKWLTSTNGQLSFSGNSYGMYLISFRSQLITACIMPSKYIGAEQDRYINLQPIASVSLPGMIRLVLTNASKEISTLKLQQILYNNGSTSYITTENFSILQLATITGV